MKSNIKNLILIVICLVAVFAIAGCQQNVVQQVVTPAPTVTVAPSAAVATAAPVVTETPEVDIYSVTMNLQSFKSDIVIEVEDGDYFKTPDDPSRDGYFFDGWYLEEKCVNEVSFPLLVIEPITLYAGWIEKDIMEYELASLEFVLNTAGDGYIVASIGEEESVFFAIPSEYNDLPVVEIADYAFENCDYITKVYIPGSVVTIGEGAFSGCTVLEGVIISEGVQTIEKDVFDGVLRISEVYLPASVSSVTGEAFSGCITLERISVSSESDYYVVVDDVLFNYDTTELVCYPNAKSNYSYVIPYSVTSVGIDAFAYSSYLYEIQVPNSVVDIHSYNWVNGESLTTFIVGVGNTAYSAVGGILYSADGTVLVKYPPALSNVEYTVSGSVTTIASYAFVNSQISELIFAEGIEEFQKYCVYECYDIFGIFIPQGILSMEKYAFYEISAMIFVDEESVPEHWSTSWVQDSESVMWNG